MAAWLKLKILCRTNLRDSLISFSRRISPALATFQWRRLVRSKCVRPDHYGWLADVWGQAAGLTKCEGCIAMRCRARCSFSSHNLKVDLGIWQNPSKGWWFVKKFVGKLQLQSQWLSGTFRHYAHTHAEACNATSLSCRNINSNSECCFDFMCRNVWAQAIRWKKIGNPSSEIFWLPLPGCHWLTQHALFCRRWYWKTKGLPHFQLESWASCFNAETGINKYNWIRIYVLLNLVTKCAWFSTNLAWFQHVLFSVARTCNLKPGQGQRQVAWWGEGTKT